MLLRRASVTNVRSFLDTATLLLDGDMTIVIGPNGGGKTNLLDTVVTVLRRYLFASVYAAHAPTAEEPNRHEFRHNDVLNNMQLERHSSARDRPQLIEVELEITARDIENMSRIKADAAELTARVGRKYVNLNLTRAENWDVSSLGPGTRLIYRVENGNLAHDGTFQLQHFLEYLQTFEMDARIRDELELAALSTPLIYLPVNRAASPLQSGVELATYNDFDIKRQSDAASSRSAAGIMTLAIGRLAQKYRLLLEKGAADQFMRDPRLVELSEMLAQLGYEWSLKTLNPLKNQYDVQLRKQGSEFFVHAASSGERELLLYLFAIFALNVRDALIIVDEPELHLHPKWQRTLLSLFIKLASTTGNQFLFATHSPTFIAPESIRYVSRVFAVDQKSRITRLSATSLPDGKHLLNIINSQNNERLFFADRVVLVEGISDRIFFEAILDHFGRSSATGSIVEVISVGGKGLFAPYKTLLEACQMPYSLIADLDYIEQVGTQEVNALFQTDASEIKKDVIDNVKSKDAAALVSAIDKAIESGKWDHSAEVWEYIKARRRSLKPDLQQEERQKLTDFLDKLAQNGTFVLKRGALEDYLPRGYADKDLEKLILLLQTDFWRSLPEEGRSELELIVRSILATPMASTA